MQLADFDFEVPEELVAQAPAVQRDHARLFVRTADGAVRHGHVYNLTTEIPPGSLVIVNDTRVFPSRLVGRTTTQAEVEVFLLAREAEPGVWSALARPLKRLRPGTTVTFSGGLSAEVIARVDDGPTPTVNLRLATPEGGLDAWLEQHAYIPLPPYIRRADPLIAANSPDRGLYQTVYADADAVGSVAAPTAGLHFTPELMSELTQSGIQFARVCLHVGAGTFLPVKSDDIELHQMHVERTYVPRSTVEAILAAKAAGRPVVVVGTTSFRALESLYRRAEGHAEKMLQAADRWADTDLFIRPSDRLDRYRPWSADVLMTNFHQPRSTLFMLVSALLGLDTAQSAYREAMREGYRLFSYGDACLFWLR